jgi:hypothetical protein
VNRGATLGEVDGRGVSVGLELVEINARMIAGSAIAEETPPTRNPVVEEGLNASWKP